MWGSRQMGLSVADFSVFLYNSTVIFLFLHHLSGYKELFLLVTRY
jgi:hypothetical protein